MAGAQQQQEALVDRVVELATRNVQAGGRPFACVIANSATGAVLAEAANEVAQTGDPTAHAEIVAIRAASRILREKRGVVDGLNGTPGEDFKGYTIYILPDPCPMCMSAMYYCGPDAVVYATERQLYSQFYTDDRRYINFASFYEDIGKPHANKKMPMRHIPHPHALEVYKLWAKLNAAITPPPAAMTSASLASVRVAPASGEERADSGGEHGVGVASMEQSTISATVSSGAETHADSNAPPNVVHQSTVGLCGADDCFLRLFVMPVHRSSPGGDFTLDGLMHGRLDLVCRCITAVFAVSYGIRRNARYRATLYDRAGVHSPRTVRIDGATAKHLRPAERELGALLLRLLQPAGGAGRNPRKLTKAQRKGQQAQLRPSFPQREPTDAEVAEAKAWEERSRRCLVGLSASEEDLEQSITAAVAEAASASSMSMGPPLVLILDEAAPLIDDPAADWRGRTGGGVVVLLGDNRGLDISEEAIATKLEENGKAVVRRVSLGPVPLLGSHCIVLLHHYLDKLAHTCQNAHAHPRGPGGGKTPADSGLRGQLCKKVGEYKGWG